MGQYRIRRHQVRYSDPADHRPGIVRLRANEHGLSLEQVFWKELPSSTFGRPATILISIRDDPVDPAFVICETRDVILDRGPDGLDLAK